MIEKTKGILVALAAVAALAVGGAAIASAAGNGDSSPQPSEPVAQSSTGEDEGANETEGPDQAIGGSALDRASAAALDHTGGGEVTDTEIGDEESYYEVEVTGDGGQVDVQLDRDFNVVSSESDEE